MKTWHLTGITSQIKGWWLQAPSEKPDTNCPTSLLISTFWKMSNLVQLQLQPTVMEDFFLPPTEVLNVNCFLSNKALFIVTMFNIKNVTGQDKHRKVSHHCPLFVGEVDSDGSSTSGWILWTGLPWGGVGGGGGGHGERQEGIGGGQGGREDTVLGHQSLRRASCTVGSRGVCPLPRTYTNKKNMKKCT